MLAQVTRRYKNTKPNKYLLAAPHLQTPLSHRSFTEAIFNSKQTENQESNSHKKIK